MSEHLRDVWESTNPAILAPWQVMAGVPRTQADWREFAPVQIPKQRLHCLLMACGFLSQDSSASKDITDNIFKRFVVHNHFFNPEDVYVFARKLDQERRVSRWSHLADDEMEDSIGMGVNSTACAKARNLRRLAEEWELHGKNNPEGGHFRPLIHFANQIATIRRTVCACHETGSFAPYTKTR